MMEQQPALVRETNEAVMRRLLIALGLIGLFSPAFAADYGLPRYDPPTLRGSDTFVPAYPTYFN
jgi:hypothetical protein